MKKILSFLFVIIGLLGYSQDEYYRKVDWKFYPENVIQLTDSTYLTDAYPFDYNDVGAIQRVVGNYVVDFVGHRYEVIDSTTTTITVLDIYHIGQAPQTGQIARCYRSVGDGEAEYIGSIDYSPLDESSRWKLNGSDNELLWRQTVGKAENGLYKDARTVKLGGDLIEPTTINQDNNSLKILNNGHGSAFSETGIAYTKIDTVDFTDSTLVTKMYVKSLIKEGTSHDSLTIDGDLSSTNEIQDLSLSGNTLSLSGDASTVDLSGYAPASGSANYIWNGTTQQVGNYNITGDGEVGGNYKTEGTLLGNITTITPIISGQNCRISYLSKIEKTKKITLAIYFHGAGETENSAFTQIDEKRITDFLISKGIIVATSYANGVAWGNQTSQDDYYDLYDYINSNFDIGKVVFIAQSMGGLASLNLLASGRIDVDCWYGIFPVTNLYNMYQGVFASEIETAYGFSGSENYSAATSGFDPNTKTNSDFPKVRIRMTASYADNLVLRSQNSDLFFTKMNGYSPKCELVSHTGDHGDPTAFIKYDVFNHIVSNNLFDGELKKENDLNTNIFNNGTRTGFNTNEFKALFQIGNSALSGINGLNDDTRTSLLIGNSGNLFGLSTLQLASTFNNATYPNYGVVLNNGSADGLNVDTWAMRNDGYANSSGGLSFAFTTGSDVLTSPHTLLLRKDGNSFFMKDIFLNQGYGLKANGISNAIVTADDGEVGAKIYAGSTGSVRIGEGINEIARFSTGSIKLIPLSGTGTRLATTLADGTLANITNASGYLYNDGTNMIWIKTVPQSLSGTTPTLNASNGVNANLSISGATTLTLSNLISGTSGTIYLTNNASVYRIKIAGYTIAPASNITYDSTGILLPASSVYTHTSIGWYYNGTTVQIHKADYNLTTY